MYDETVDESEAGRFASLCSQAADHMAEANRVLNESPEDIAWAVARLSMALRYLRDCELEVLEHSPAMQAASQHVVWSPTGIGWRVGTSG